MKTVTLIVVASLGLGACAKNQSLADLPPQPGGTTGSAQAGSGSTATAIVPGSQADFLARMNGRNVIYFDTDRFNVDEEDMVALRAQAEWLMQYPNTRATIEGHCDERGTREYNLALGERRANAAKNYLVSLGIDSSRLTTVSYGKERPVALGSNESAWSQNRRAATLTIS
ncbi:MAG TPA: peptidoglycan-associated lipoprotein Pal [Sphingomonadaceae bacterium]|nr:peptidoglycan-associated lipoprotein Pal [Sphingomonadaceae bacterium]